ELARRLHGGAEVSRRGAAVPRFPVCILRGGISREHARRGLDARRLRDDPRVSICPSWVCVALGLVRGVFLRKGTDGTECAASLRAGGGALRPACDRVCRSVFFLGKGRFSQKGRRKRRRGAQGRRRRSLFFAALPSTQPSVFSFPSKFRFSPLLLSSSAHISPMSTSTREARSRRRSAGPPAAAPPCPARAGARAPPAALAIQAGVTLTEGDAPWRGQGRRRGPRSRARAGRTTGGTPGRRHGCPRERGSA